MEEMTTMMWGYPGFGGAGLFHGGFMMLLWPLLLVGLVILLVRLFRGEAVGCCVGGHGYASAPRAGSPDDAREIARQRYARGEISKEQYFEILATLGR
jgi:uncharacterized membrane protein